MGNTPNIRFKGFTDDWEQRKLGEVFQEYSEKNHPELPALTIIQGGGTVLREESERKLQYDKSSLAGYKMVREDDFIVHLRSFEGGLEKSNHNGLISPAYHTFHGDEVDSRFYYPYFRSYEFIKHKLVPHVYGIRDGRSIDIDGMKTIEIPWTSYEEQKKIGDYIESLDTLITLHQRKCDETKKLKKFMLQKMFPKKDAKKPEIRFAGFTDDWEQRKLGDDLVSIHTGTNLLGSITNTGMPLIKMGNIQRGYFDTLKVEFLAENEQPDKADIANYGDFFFNTRNTLELVGKGATWMKNSGEYAFNSNIARFELRNLDTIFFNYLYNTDYMTKQIHARAMGTTSVAAIYPRTLDSVEYSAPCMKEQQKIGAYFKQLDHLITLHQRKCDELKEFKKYMLQNMFPQKG